MQFLSIPPLIWTPLLLVEEIMNHWILPELIVTAGVIVARNDCVFVSRTHKSDILVQVHFTVSFGLAAPIAG